MINITENFGKGGNLMTKKKFTEEELRFNEDIKKNCFRHFRKE